MNMKPIGGMLLLMVSTFACAQQSFSTPEQAANALTKAISEQNERAMADLLGITGATICHLKELIRRRWLDSCVTGRYTIVPKSAAI